MASPWRAVMTAVAAVILAGSMFGGAYVEATVLAVLGCVFAMGWPVLISAPAPRSAGIVIAISAVAAAAVVALEGSPIYLTLVLAFGVMAAFIHQMARSNGRGDLVNAVSATVAGIVVVVSSSGWILAFSSPMGDETVIAALVVLVVASAVTAMPVNSLLVAGIAALLGAGVGLGVGWYLPHLSLLTGAISGLVSGAMMSLTHVVLGGFPAVRKWGAAMAAALLPMLVLGIPIHLIGTLAS